MTIQHGPVKMLVGSVAGLADPAPWDNPGEHVMREWKRSDDFAAALRKTADLIEAGPVIAPYWLTIEHDFDAGRAVVTVCLSAASPKLMREMMRAIGSDLSTPWTRHTSGSRPMMARQIDIGETCAVRFEISAAYGRCDRVEVGTEIVEKDVEVCPRCEADLIVKDTRRDCMAADCGWSSEAPAKVRRPVETPKFEVRCPDVLADEEEEVETDEA